MPDAIHVMMEFAMEFPLIFGETNFMEIPKIAKFSYGPHKEHPMVALCA